MDDSNGQNQTKTDAELQALLKQLGHANPFPNKRLAMAYVLLGLFGFLGAHRLYLKSKLGFVQLFFGLFGLASVIPLYATAFTNDMSRDTQLTIVLFFVFGIIALMVVGVWVIVDHFLLHGRALPTAETEGKLPGKRMATAFILLYFLGSFGAHRLYLKHWLGFVQLILGLTTLFGGFAVGIVSAMNVADALGRFEQTDITAGDLFGETGFVIYLVLSALYFVWYAVIDRIWLYRRAG